jgi:ligand-binding SRPBCC domain-containing protein
MVQIELVTTIAAPIERCFDLSRSIDLHMASTNWTGERAIAGVTSGLIAMNEEVTLHGRHFGVPIQHTSRITAFDPPRHFQDCMVRGAFKRFCHDHHFESVNRNTRMIDRIQFSAPLGVLGRLVEPLLERHMRALLVRRNECIKRTAEGNSWTEYLGSGS